MGFSIARDVRSRMPDAGMAFSVCAVVNNGRPGFAIRYCHVEILPSARKHGTEDEDIAHAVDQAVVAGDQDDGKVLYLGPDRAGNLLEVVAVVRDDGTEVVIHAMRMRRIYEPFLRGKGDNDG